MAFPQAAVAAIALAALMALTFIWGKVELASQSVDMAAFQSARDASLARNESAARSRATKTAERIMREQGVDCQRVRVRLSTGQFGRRAGRSAQISAEVTCRVNLRDVTVPGLPGSHTLSASAVSPLDTYTVRD